MIALSVARGEFERAWIEVRRYPLNTAALVVILYVFFMAIFLGVKAMVGDLSGQFESKIAFGIVGYSMWFFAVAALGDMPFQIMRESTTGTLEQLIMSPAGLARILAGRAVGNLLVNFTYAAVMLVLIMASTGIWLSLPAFHLAPVVLLTLVSLWGVGFLLAGLALNFKRVEMLTSVMQFVFFGLAMVPLATLPPGLSSIARGLPLGVGVDAINGIVLGGDTIGSLASSGRLGVLALNSAAYAAVGVFVYTRLERLARRRGVVGHY